MDKRRKARKRQPLRNAYLNARKYNITMHDSIYFTHAYEQGFLLYTGDKKFYNAVKIKKELVRWIGDYRRAE